MPRLKMLSLAQGLRISKPLPACRCLVCCPHVVQTEKGLLSLKNAVESRESATKWQLSETNIRNFGSKIIRSCFQSENKRLLKVRGPSDDKFNQPFRFPGHPSFENWLIVIKHTFINSVSIVLDQQFHGGMGIQTQVYFSKYNNSNNLWTYQ